MNRNELKQIWKNLLMNKNGTRVLKGVQIYFKVNNALSHEGLKNEFERLENLEEIIFWKKIVEILKNSYCKSEINSEKLLTLSKTNFEEFIKELEIFHFDELFEEKEEKILKGVIDLNGELFSNSKVYKDSENKIIRIIYAYEKKYRGNVKPHTSGEKEFFPNLLIKLNYNTGKIHFSGSIKERILFVSKINGEEGHSENIISDLIDDYDNFKVDAKNLLLELNKNNQRIKKLSYSDKDISINIHSKKDHYDIFHVVNNETLLEDTIDILNLKEVGVLLINSPKEIGEEINYSLVIEKNLSSGYFKINLLLDHRLKGVHGEKLTKKISNILDRLKIKVNTRYNLPIAYYFNSLFQKRNIKEFYYNKIIDLDKENNLLTLLEKEKIVSKTPFKFNLERFTNIFLKELKKHADKETIVNENHFKLIEVNKDKSRISLRVKIYSDKKDTKFSRHYTIIISTDSRFNEYEKILYPVIEEINYYYIFNERETDKILKYLYDKIQYCILEKYGLNLEKEIHKAFRLLKNYVSPTEKHSEDAKKEGKEVELAINIILKYIYGNYSPLGGPNEPDGVLELNNISYMIDSKQHKQISKSELRKFKDYLDHPPQECDGDIEGILVVCKNKLKSEGSLNLNSRKKLSCKDKIGFFTVEFLLEFFDLYITHKSKITSNAKLKESYLNLIKNIVSESKDLNKISELRNLEKSKISEFIRKLDNLRTYIPEGKEAL